MKYVPHLLSRRRRASPSSRRAWIEISSTTKILQSRLTSPSSRRAWIEIRAFTFLRSVSITSPSSRRAWIEIIMYPATEPLKQRRPPRGGRGLKYSLFEIFVFIGGRPPRGGRGLKSRPDMGAGNGKQSPSSRRAWIEIRIFACPHSSVLSRPPRGGRGLKSLCRLFAVCACPSPSSRRAWIEIPMNCFQCSHKMVALLAEGVD